MPRVKEIRAEVGTTGTIVSLPISGDMKRDIGSAVEEEHSCEDSACDIAAALRAGFPLVAAHSLQGATETPLLDAVVSLYASPFEQSHELEWDEWLQWFEEHGRECESCGSFTFMDEHEHFECGNCLASFAPRPDFESDAFIQETREGYSVSVEGSLIGTFSDIDGARRGLLEWMQEHEFYPEMWEVNERGNTELLEVDPSNPATLKHAGRGYV